MIYKISRSINFSHHLRPVWLIMLLYKIPPQVYEKCSTVEECQSKLDQISKIISDSQVIYTNRNKTLRKVKKIICRDNKIEILSMYGKLQLVFKIEKFTNHE